jgi:hypothetical protein
MGSIPSDIDDRVVASLDKLSQTEPPKPKPTIKSVVEDHYDLIITLLEKGYTKEQVVDTLIEAGLKDLTVNSFQRYLRDLKKVKPVSKKSRSSRGGGKRSTSSKAVNSNSMTTDTWHGIFDEFNDSTTVDEMQAHLKQANDEVQASDEYSFLEGQIQIKLQHEQVGVSDDLPDSNDDLGATQV